MLVIAAESYQVPVDGVSTKGCKSQLLITFVIAGWGFLHLFLPFQLIMHLNYFNSKTKWILLFCIL